MSGIGEAIALVSCVAGLIQALDSGSRIVRQIKQRRQAHRAAGALPPSDLLENTIEEGRQQIEKVVAKGNARFGGDFEAGDVTARLALYEVTIQIQNALLKRLEGARSDDGIIDFEECIDLSDQGCNDALVALNALYQRKLREDIERKSQHKQVEESPQPEEPQEVKQGVPSPPPKPALNHYASDPLKYITRVDTTTPPQPNERRKRRLGSMFQSKLPKPEQSQPLPPPTPTPLPRRDTAPAAPAQLQRTSTTSSQTSSIPERSMLNKRSSMSSDHSGLSPAKSTTDQVGQTQYSWSPGMSRASTLASISSNAAISTWGGCCKYSHYIREKGAKAGLGMISTAMYSENFIYQCKSTKCSFGKEAVKMKKGWEIDDTVYTSQGIQFRWLFLAKSHIQIPKDTTIKLKPYKCLICLVLNHNSETYLGTNELFAHILEHREKRIGDVKLEGPLSFSNQGAVVDAHFDINLPEFEASPAEEQPTHGTPEVVTDAEILKQKLEDFAMGGGSKPGSMVSYSTGTSVTTANTDPSFNPWTLH